MYKIFIDGSCWNNGLPNCIGGWSYMLVDENYNIVAEDYGKLRSGIQSSSRAELESLYRALLKIEELDISVEIVTDYKTLVDLITGDGTRTANRDLWDQIEPLMLDLVGKVSITHVGSHKKDDSKTTKFNNIVDKLAQKGAKSLLIAPIEA